MLQRHKDFMDDLASSRRDWNSHRALFPDKTTEYPAYDEEESDDEEWERKGKRERKAKRDQ